MLRNQVFRKPQDWISKKYLPYFFGAQIFFWTLAWALYGFANPFSNHLIPGAVGGDRTQEVWFFSWFAHALSHGTNPFVTGILNAPHGVNLMSNTSAPLLGLLGAPITWILGPIATYNFFLHASLALSSTTALYAARRVGLARIPSFVVGLIFGFSSEQTVQAQGHVFMTCQILTPLIFLWSYEILTRSDLKGRRGIPLGLAIAGQYLISSEQLLISLLTVVVGFVVAVPFFHRSASRRNWSSVRQNFPRALIVAGFLMAVPMYYQMSGPLRTKGPSHEWVNALSASVMSFFLPQYYALGWPWGHRSVINNLAITAGENGAYIGFALLAVCGMTVIAHRRNRSVWWLLVTTSFVLTLTLGGHSRTIPMPDRAIMHLYLFESILPIRFMTVAWAGIALLVGLGVQYAVMKWRRDRILPLALVALSALGILAICPAQVIAPVAASVPSWFSSPTAIHGLAHGTVLEYPYPSAFDDQGMLYQAMGPMNYSLVGGEAIVGSGHHGESLGARPLTPRLIPDLFFQAAGLTSASAFSLLTVNHYVVGPITSPTRAVGTVRQFMKENHITDVVVLPVGDFKLVRTYLTLALGAPRTESGKLLWWHLSQKLR